MKGSAELEKISKVNNQESDLIDREKQASKSKSFKQVRCQSTSCPRLRVWWNRV